jgi:hypothetical protein
MAKTKISEFSSTPANNTDINSIDIAEGCAPSGINNAIRSLMSDLKDWQAGLVATSNTDALAVAGGGTGSITATDARTNLEAAKSGANSDITSLSGLTTPITVAQGGTGFISQRTITTVGRATNVVTIVTSVAHGYVVNDIVTIAAVTNTSVNGTFLVASVPTSTSFTYAQAGTDYANTADTGTVNSSSYLVAGNISGVVSVSHGGTGTNTLKPNNLFLGNGTSSPTVIPAGLAGNLLTSTTTSTVNAGSFAIGTEYTIASLGTPTATNFTLIGAASNTVGVVFTATGVGAGNGTATTNTWTSTTLVNNKLTSMTAQATTSGTAKDFTGIPSWVKKITVIFNGVSLATASTDFLVQIGGSSIETTGYNSTSGFISGTSASSIDDSTSGFIITSIGIADTLSGILTISNITGSTWIASGTFKLSTSSSVYVGGDKTITGTLSQVRITSTTGATFDAGSVNVMYE